MEWMDKKVTKQSAQSACFERLMLGMQDQAFLFDATTWQLVNASQSACQSFGMQWPTPQPQSIEAVLGVSQKDLMAALSSAAAATSTPFAQWQFSRIEDTNHAYLLAIKHSTPHNDTRFNRLVQNTPGLVFEFHLEDNKQIQFAYISDGSYALLGIAPEALKQAPQHFFAIIHQADRKRLEKNIQTSAANLSLLNWEGRVWIEAWQDTKWVNIRATPTTLASGMLQWSGIMTNITHSKQEKIELAQSRKRLAVLAAHLNTVKEQERARISRELHDDLGGNLTVVKMGLSALLKHMPDSEQVLIEKTQQLKTVIDATFEAVHRISSDLRPNILELGLVAALAWQAKQFEQQFEIACVFTTNNNAAQATPEQAITLFRVCQEAMSNIAKYAQATRVEVDLVFATSHLALCITDNGIGMQPSDRVKPDTFGLLGMQERVLALKGVFKIESPITATGTRIRVRLPNT